MKGTNLGHGDFDFMFDYDSLGITGFLKSNPGMSIVPNKDNKIVIKGNLSFYAQVHGNTEINDSYKLEIVIPKRFPREIPIIKEIGLKIPREIDYHVNENGTICLGSPLMLLKKLYEHPDLNGFYKSCLLPYLYAVSIKLKTGKDFLFGQLPHYAPGAIEDYISILGLRNKYQVIETLKLLSMKKRVANKCSCSCGCEKRLGICTLNNRVNEFRRMAPRAWFRKQFEYLVRK